MATFKYCSPYGVYENCYFRVGHYGNFRNKGGIAIEIWSDEEGPIAKVTVNLDIPLAPDEIAVKDYAENTGMVLSMQKIGLIGEAIKSLRTGFVNVPIFKLNKEVLEEYS